MKAQEPTYNIYSIVELVELIKQEIEPKIVDKYLGDFFLKCVDLEIQRANRKLGPDFKPSEKFEKLVKNVGKYLLSNHGLLDSSKGLLLMGGVGTGKSSILKAVQTFYSKLEEAITNLYLENDIKPTHSASDLISRLKEKRGWGNTLRMPSFVECNELSLNQLYNPNLEEVKAIAKQNYVILDDMGRDQIAQSYGNSMDPILAILDLRYNNRMLTHISTNLNEEGIKKRYGVRMLSRLSEVINFVEVSGPDQRSNDKVKISI